MDQDLPNQAQDPTMTGQSIPTILPPNPTALTQPSTMPLPPEAQYTSRTALLEAIQA